MPTKFPPTSTVLLRPSHSPPRLMTLPRQLHDPQPVPRILRLDRKLALAPHSISQVLIESTPPSRDGGIVTDEFLAFAL